MVNENFLFILVLVSYFVCLKNVLFWKVKFVNIIVMFWFIKVWKCIEIIIGDLKYFDEFFNCIICLEKVVCWGKLSVCNYWFCF